MVQEHSRCLRISAASSRRQRRMLAFHLHQRVTIH